MKNEKILKIIIALLSVFVIAAGIYIIIGQPGNGITEDTDREMPVRDKPTTSVRDEDAEIDLNELSPAYSESNREDYYTFNDDFGNTNEPENTYGGGAVLNVYDINYELYNHIQNYYLDDISLPEGVEIKCTSTSSGRYEDTLKALKQPRRK
jgi:hypothetical protein